jgi:hypothetical protein
VEVSAAMIHAFCKLGRLAIETTKPPWEEALLRKRRRRKKEKRGGKLVFSLSIR